MATLQNWIRNGSLPFFAKKARRFPLSEADKRQLDRELKESRRLQSRVNRRRMDRSSDIPQKIAQLLTELNLEALDFIYLYFHIQAQNLGSTVMQEELEKWPQWKELDVSRPLLHGAEILNALEALNPIDPAGELLQRSQCSRSAARRGSYFTPQPMVDDLIKGLGTPADKRFLDPALGSGRFLLAFLRAGGDPKLCLGVEKDTWSLRVARMNFLLAYPAWQGEIPMVQDDFLAGDWLSRNAQKSWDLIVTNPPWGSIPRDEKNPKAPRDLSQAFCLQAMDCLEPRGTMALLLPQSLVSQKKHQGLRKDLFARGSVERLWFQDGKFPGVQSPPISLYWTNQHGSQEMEIRLQGQSYSRSLDSFKDGLWDLTMTPQDKMLEQKMLQASRQFLGDLPIHWLLGIVSGDNRRRISDKPGPKQQRILRGRDIEPGQLKEASHWLNCPWKELQQHGPMELYRSPVKLIYRFIGTRPICALDTQGQLILNSANAMVMDDPQELKFLELLLNSRLYGYYYRRKFHSLKILRSHLESLPLPDLSKEERARWIVLGGEDQGRESFESLLQEYYSIRSEDYGQ